MRHSLSLALPTPFPAPPPALPTPSLQQFWQVLLGYHYVFFFRDKLDGTLRGMFLMDIRDHCSQRRRYKVIKVGPTRPALPSSLQVACMCPSSQLGLALFYRDYRGGPLIFMAVLYHVGKHLVLHPFTPVYIIGKAFSYMSYLVSGWGRACHGKGHVICVHRLRSLTSQRPILAMTAPRYQSLKRGTRLPHASTMAMCHIRAAPPSPLPLPLPLPLPSHSIMDEFGASFASLEDIYDPATCVIHIEKSTLKPYIAPIKDHLLQNPHIQYFQQLNPEWHKVPCPLTPTPWTQCHDLMYVPWLCSRVTAWLPWR